MDLHVPYLYYIRGDKCRRVVGAGRSNKYGIWFIWTHRNSPRVLSEAFDSPRQFAENLSPLPSAISFVILGQISHDLSSNLGKLTQISRDLRLSQWDLGPKLLGPQEDLALPSSLLCTAYLDKNGTSKIGHNCQYLQFHKCSQIRPAWRHYILMF